MSSYAYIKYLRGTELGLNTPSTKVQSLALLAAGRAETSLMRERIGAVASRGKNIYEGVNALVTHPIQAKLNFDLNPFRKWLHAEISCMIHAKWQAEKLVVVRLLADGTWGFCKPCEGCQRALAGVEVWYSTGKGHLALAKL